MTKKGIVGGCLTLVAVMAAPMASPESRAIDCPVSRADENKSFGFGEGALRVAIHWPAGTLPAGELANGGFHAVVNTDGSISVKLGWWRGVPGQLEISGKRLDRSAGPLEAEIPSGYEETGFQPSGLTFPTLGCWKVHGSVGQAQLTFVVHVVPA